MARPLDIPNQNFIPAGTALNANYTSPVLDLLGCLGASVTIVGAGTTVAGTWQLWVSNVDSPTTATATALTGASATVSGSPGVVQLDFAVKARYAFLVWTNNGSSGDAKVANGASRSVAAGTV